MNTIHRTATAALALAVLAGSLQAADTPKLTRRVATPRVAAALPAVPGALAGRRFLPLKQGATAASAAKVRVASAQAKLLKLNLATPGLEIEDLAEAGMTFKTLRVPGAGRTTQVGMPELPVQTSQVQIPYGATAAVKNIKSTSKILDGYDVAPAQPQPEDSPTWKAGPFQRNAGVYATDGWFPPQIVTVSPPEVIRGVTMVTVSQYPVQYNPKKRQIRVHDDITYDLVISGGAPAPVAEAAEKRFSPAFHASLAQNVLNFKLPVKRVVINEAILAAVSGSDYLIIATDALADAVEPLAAHKRTKGLITRVVKRSDIGANPTAAQIRAYISNEYFQKSPAPTYVLLVGDVDTIPAFQPSTQPNYGAVQVATDNPYGCVEGGDALPDIYVGRLPARTASEVTQMVNKIITWETDIAADTGYTTQFLMAAYFQDDDRNNVDDRRYLQTIHNISKYLGGKTTAGGKPLGMRRVYVVPSGVSTSIAGKKDRDGVPLEASISFSANGTSDCVNWLNAPVGFAFHRDHGYTGGWSAPALGTAQVAQMTGPKPWVMYSVNCSSGQYDGDCFAEQMMRRTAPSGAASIVAASRVSPTWINDDMTRGLTDAMYPGLISNHAVIDHLGPALDHAKHNVANLYGGPANADVRRQFELYQIFGDPDLRIVYRPTFQFQPMLELYKPWLKTVTLKAPVVPTKKPVARRVIKPRIR